MFEFNLYFVKLLYVYSKQDIFILINMTFSNVDKYTYLNVYFLNKYNPTKRNQFLLTLKSRPLLSSMHSALNITFINVHVPTEETARLEKGISYEVEEGTSEVLGLYEKESASIRADKTIFIQTGFKLIEYRLFSALIIVRTYMDLDNCLVGVVFWVRYRRPQAEIDNGIEEWSKKFQVGK